MYYEHQYFLDDDLKIIHHIDRFKKGSGFLAHIQYNLEILLMRKGSAEISIDDQTIIVKENELCIIPPNRIHKGFTHSECCEYHCLIIDHSLYDNWFKAAEQKFPLKCTDQAIVNACKSVFNLLEQKPRYYKQEINAHIILMFANLFRLGNEQSVTDGPASDNHRIDMTRAAIIYMYKNFTSDISIDDIANAAGFSKYYFCRCFKEITGQTPLNYLNYIRLKSAKALLKSGSSNITETALKCGFNNASYFCKLYKKYFGKSPKQDM